MALGAWGGNPLEVIFGALMKHLLCVRYCVVMEMSQCPLEVDSSPLETGTLRGSSECPGRGETVADAGLQTNLCKLLPLLCPSS